ncbi:hypothetical protein [Microbacterium sp.]|uniref:hypothetical protein n=1 Tax=Microbacterium sp. TaxID=51671 RepID=UPI001ACD4984|nr:hypothetical protein [Microbacterium sp.]MBN9156904.1 hypothetical protein [Microbacterium sp.]
MIANVTPLIDALREGKSTRGWEGPEPIRAIAKRLYAREDIRALEPSWEIDLDVTRLIVCATVMGMSEVGECGSSAFPDYRLAVNGEVLQWSGQRVSLELLRSIGDEALRDPTDPSFNLFATYALLGSRAASEDLNEIWLEIQKVRRGERPRPQEIAEQLPSTASEVEIVRWVKEISLRDARVPSKAGNYWPSVAMWEFGGEAIWSDSSSHALEQIAADAIRWGREFTSDTSKAPGRLRRRKKFSVAEERLAAQIVQGRIAKALFGAGSGPRGLNRYHGEVLTPFAIQVAQRSTSTYSRHQAEALAAIGLDSLTQKEYLNAGRLFRSKTWPLVWYLVSLIVLVLPICLFAGWLIGPVATDTPLLAGLCSFVAASVVSVVLWLCRRFTRFESWVLPKIPSLMFAILMSMCLLAISFWMVANWWYVLLLVPAVVIDAAILYPFVRSGVFPRLSLSRFLRAGIRGADYNAMLGIDDPSFTTLDDFPGDVNDPRLMRYKAARWF